MSSSPGQPHVKPSNGRSGRPDDDHRDQREQRRANPIRAGSSPRVEGVDQSGHATRRGRWINGKDTGRAQRQDEDGERQCDTEREHPPEPSTG